ncbi:zinc finger protein 628-like [Artemia franciscana]|uniref:Uncharacterized protein n=1 Tax=Artemia franciscana TaxID=6661 RepID=A0AA88I0X2_ARTSF|nr:hypothetical protein QYM36_006709 [Artemia franciscana]
MGSPNDVAEPGPAEPPLSAGSDAFCLRWKDHSQHLLDVFGQLYQDEALVDVTLAVEGRSIRAHKMVLSACSSFFRDLFASHPESHPIIILNDTPYSELQTLLDFMYKGEVNVEQENLDNLLRTAHELCIRGLADILSQCKARSNTLNSASTTLDVATSDDNYLNYCNRLIKREYPSGEELSDSNTMRAGSVENEMEGESPMEDKVDDAADVVNEEAQDLSRPFVPLPSSPPTVNMYPNSVISTVQKFNWPAISDSEESDGEMEESSIAPGVASYSQPVCDAPSKLSPEQTGSCLEQEQLQSNDPLQDENQVEQTKCDGKIPEEEDPQGPNSPSGNSTQIIPMYGGRFSFPGGPTFPGLRTGVGVSPNHQGDSSQRQMFAFPGQSGEFPFFQMLPFDFGLRFPYQFPPPVHERAPTSEDGNSPKTCKDGISGQSSKVPPLGLKGVTEANRDIAQALIESHLGQGYSLGSREKPYKCDQCGQCYKYLSAFSKHKEQNHTARLPGEKPFRCEVCGMQFKYLKSFKKHRLNHAVERLQQPFQRTSGEERSVLDMLGKSPSEQSPEQPKPLVTGSAPGTPTPMAMPTGAQPLPLNSAQSLPSCESDATSPTKKNDDVAEDLTQPKSVEQPNPAPGPSRTTEQDSTSLEQQMCICPSCKGRFYNEESLRIHSASCRSQTEERRFHPHLDHSGFYEIVRRQALMAARAAMDAKIPVNPSTEVKQNAVPPPISTPSGATNIAPRYDSTPEETMDISDRETSDPDNEDQQNDPNCFHRSLNFPQPNFSFPSGPPGSSHLQLAVFGHPPFGSLPPDYDPGRPHLCPFCGKGFRAKENLKLHIRKHTGERPFQCGYCHRAFGGKSDMNRHVRIHTGERPYRCDACGKTFARADYLSKHLSTHLA